MRWCEIAAQQPALGGVVHDQLIAAPALTPTILGSPQPVRRLLAEHEVTALKPRPAGY